MTPDPTVPRPGAIPELRKDAVRIFKAGLSAVDPYTAVMRACRVQSGIMSIGNREYDLQAFDHIYVIGAGKASAPMAAAIETLLGSRLSDGIITVKYGYSRPLSRIRLIEAGHPVPDVNGYRGGKKILQLAGNAGKNDLVICLISGGGSALLPVPVSGVTLEDKQQCIRILLNCGAAIHEINAIRKHISLIKGGRLARCVYPATLVTLLMSDVVGDQLDVIASGPAVADPSTFGDCMAIMGKYQIADQLPASVLNHIRAGLAGKITETPKAKDPVFETSRNLIIGSNINALSAAEQEAIRLGYHTLVLSSMLEGDTREAAHFHCAIAREILKTGKPVPSPACIISGGETTVRVTGPGLGGRNQEFALAASIHIDGLKNTVILSGGTDGTDGPTDAAGALADHLTVSRAKELNLSADHYLAQNDSYHFFKQLDDLLMTGPTRTNVMDLRIMLIR